MTVASFERIDYQLRNNKHIERQLIFGRLARASSLVDFGEYRYLGFGSMWFVDFRMAHRILAIHDMVSMERTKHAERAEFNSPFRCIQVVGGESAATITGFSREDWKKPVIAWLDYDGNLDSSVSRDIGAMLDKAAVGSVVLASVNASFLNYRPRNIQGPRKREQTALGQVESMLGAAVVPPRYDKGTSPGGNHQDVGEEEFAEFLAVAILSWMVHYTGKAKRMVGNGVTESLVSFLPLFNYCHKDGVEMVTVGGVLIDKSTLAPWKERVGEGIEWSAVDAGLPIHERLDLIPLTVKEKVLLDRCLPRDRLDFLASARAEGLRIADEYLSKYWRYYRQFPMYFETPL